MASTVPAAKTNLIALLQAHTWPGSTPVISWGAPTEAEDYAAGGEMIYLGDEIPTAEFATLGGERLDETYTLPVVIDVTEYGDDERATELRARALRDEVMLVLRTNPTLGGAVNRQTGFRYPRGSLPQPGQWRAQLDIEVTLVGHDFRSQL